MACFFSWSLLLIFFVEYGRAEEKCERNYNLIGCYEEYNPGVLLFNDRHNIIWQDIAAYMEGLACKCSRAAKAKGYAGFAMHYFGECYGRSSSQLIGLGSKEHIAGKCVGDQTYTQCNKAEHDHCTGGDFAEAIYQFKASSEENVDGGLGDWEEWTPCDKECGNGHRYRERNCNNPLPKGSGKDCSELGTLSEREVCKIKECPVDGGWTQFGEYGICSVTCGGGYKSRSRTCTNPKPAHGGQGCVGTSVESVVCNTQQCPVDGGWSAYGAYGSCSKVCDGGIKKKTRTCNNPSPAHGGKQCSGPSQESASCNTFNCPDVVSCATKYTSYQTHSGGNMVYIDRHRLNCGGTGYILSMFHLQRSGKKMRYQYKCCNLKDKQACTLQKKTTSFSSDGDGDAVYLDRHTADCGNNGFINDFKVERNSGHNKVRYSYYCCMLKSPWSGKSSCYTSETSMTDDGNGKVYYLDRQTVSCRSGYALSYFKLKRNGAHTKWAYRYRCCKVNY